MKTYLVEAYSDNIVFDKDSLIIALTPEVCYQLEKKGLKYSIVEDYYDTVELSNHVEEYRLSVFGWIDEFDKFLKNSIKGLDLNLATIYRWYLKGKILDPIYLRCYTLRHLFGAIHPTEATYFVQKPAEPHLDDKFDNCGRSLFSIIIPILCRENNIPLTTVFYEAAGEKVNTTNSASQEQGLISRLKKVLFKNQVIRRIYFIYRCFKNLPRFNKAKQKKLNIFLVRVAHIGEDFIAEALVRGHRVFLLSGNRIIKYSWFGGSKHLKLKSSAPLDSEFNWGNAADALVNSEIVNRVNKKCQLDVSEIILDRLRYFILRVCPELVNYVNEFMKFYEKDHIDLLFTPVIADLEDCGAITAAKRCPAIKKAILVHGDAVYDSRVWNIIELQDFDIHITSNLETTEYFRRLADEIHSPAKLYSNPYRLRNITRIFNIREKRGAKTILKKRIIYLPLFMVWDAIRMDGGLYTDTWYYKFQKSLIVYFSTRKDYTFVWKGLPQADRIYNPIPDFISNGDFSNIEIATNSFPDYLLTADRVICDCPSTGFYEAVIAGTPVMSLYHASLTMRPGAVEYFKNLLHVFKEPSEAIKLIDEFLNGDQEQYKIKLNVDNGSLFNIL